METDTYLKIKKQAIRDCSEQFKLPHNPAITDDILSYQPFPNKPSKTLAILIMTYYREATITELKVISDQPAGLIRTLRNKGFVFKANENTPNKYLYTNKNNETCRKIIEFQTPKIKIEGKIKSIIYKSVAACISAIEIYNKPDFKYREEIFSILLVNAWELLLKAKIISNNNNQLKSIYVIEKRGEIKKNRSGNPFTIDINKAIKVLLDRKEIDDYCEKNIVLLIEIRDNAIHYVNNNPNLKKKVQEIGTASLKNYITAINDWFNIDLSKYDFYLMPMSFFYPTDIDATSVHTSNKKISNILKYFLFVENNYPSDENNTYNVTLQIKTKFVKVANEETIEVKYTNREDAPEIKVTEENIIKEKYPLSYKDLIAILKKRYSNFKQNSDFYSKKRELENQDKYKDRFCKIRYMDPNSETGQNRKFYSTEIIKEFNKIYKKK